MISVSSLTCNLFHKSASRYVIIAGRGILPVILFLILAVSCNRGAEIQKEDLFGKWDIVRAVRNGNETPYLRGGYFIIEHNGTMTVNITGSDEKGPYTLEEKTLRAYNAKDFNIHSISADSMSLRFQPGAGSEFMIFLQRDKDEKH